MLAVAGTAEPTGLRIRAPASWAVPAFVWGAWALMLAANLALVAYGASSLPIGDEFFFVPYLVGEEPVTLDWLWAQHAEHRTPLAKLLWVGVLRLTGYDFRVGNYLSVLATAAVALALVRAARRLRGRTRLADSFFPLALLTFGQAYAFLWFWVINQLLAPLAACGLLLILLRKRIDFRTAALAGVCMVLLSLSGPGGLPYVLAAALWLASWLALRRKSPEPLGRWRAALVLGLAGVAVVLTGLYFVGYNQDEGLGSAHADLSGGRLGPALKTGLQVLSVSLGSATRNAWPYWGLAIAALGLASMRVAATA